MNSNPLLKRKIFLYITEFLSGIALMGVETAANRLLAPYFSSSQVVWTLIIGTILIAMSIGNYVGGRLADKKNDVTLLYILMLCAGTYICLIPFVGRFVIAGITALFALFINSGLIIISSLVVCLILFVPPLLILGMVTPSLIKFTMGQKASGKIVGLLEALNTIGSIIGTFIPTFISIPLVGTSLTFAIFGGLICLVAIIYLLTGIINNFKNNRPEKVVDEEQKQENEEKKHSFVASIKRSIAVGAMSLVSIFGIVLSANSPFVFWGDKSIIYTDESQYNYLQVSEDDEGYYFSTNVLFGIQSMIKKDMSMTGMYYDYCLAAPYMANIDQKPNFKVLILGNGTGTYATLMKHYFPYETDITGVEIDQKIIDLSSKYFMMPDSIKTVCDDGRNYINLHDEKYDLIMVDAFSSISTPFSMSSVEFFKGVKEHLVDDGVMVMNINMKTESKSSLATALSDTLCSQFDYRYKFDVPSGSGVEVFASNSPAMYSNLERGIGLCTHSNLKAKLNEVNAGSKEHIDTGIRLYDDNADVEMRAIVSIDSLINDELSYYRKIFRERGLGGLIKELLGQK